MHVTAVFNSRLSAQCIRYKQGYMRRLCLSSSVMMKTALLGARTCLEELNPGHKGRGIIEAELDDVGQHDLQVLDASLELVVVIMPSVTVHVQNAVV